MRHKVLKGLALVGAGIAALGLIMLASVVLNMIGLEFANSGRVWRWEFVGLSDPTTRALCGFGILVVGAIVSRGTRYLAESDSQNRTQ